MPRKDTPTPEHLERPRLTKPKAEAQALIQRQIDACEELLRAGAQTTNTEALQRKYKLWRDFTERLLRKLFTSPTIAEDFLGRFHVGYRQDPRGCLEDVLSDINARVDELTSVLGQLELFDEIVPPEVEEWIEGRSLKQSADHTLAPMRDVFVVHGHHEASKHAVARFLQKLELHPIILHEQADKGRTIIQKFEDHSEEVGFSVVILSPDDEGRLAGTAALKPRARQNVILELGFFLGKLTRQAVCALKIGDVEEPSDLIGVLYIPYDAADGWKAKLAKELKAAGFDIDMNLL